MKLCITGAGSSRLPLMMASVTKAIKACHVDDVTLFDIRPERITALMPIGIELSKHVGTPPRFRIAESFADAVEGCGALILTIRPGFEGQRARDERTCLNLGVLGQETTGPAGFAFATRTIPAVTSYCAVAERLAPGFLPVIFTNPAGMVTQALHDEGFSRAVGICDSATEATKKVARLTGANFDDLTFEVSGLNHLSWTRKITDAGGKDLLTPALQDVDFLKKALPWYHDEVRGSGRIPVEYLYYFLRAEEALSSILAEGQSRGEAIVTTNANLFNDIKGVDTAAATIRYAQYLFNRNDTYMSYALGHRHGGNGPATMEAALKYLENEIGGYAEVAMELLAGTTASATASADDHARPKIMALNVINGTSIPELDPTDVVETDCIVDSTGIRPTNHGRMPPEDAALVCAVKEYERLAVSSILMAMKGGRRAALVKAEDALTAHPLVPGRDMARQLVRELKLFREGGF
jgi:6-phospho-beta-glucosidase